MVMTTTIRPACERDASWIAAHLRPQDHKEVFCQLTEDTYAMEVAMILLHTPGSLAYIAYYKDRPAALFGVTPMTPYCLSVWAVGTKDMRKVVPGLTDFFAMDLVPVLIEQGYKTMEARSIEGHTEAHRWMESTGAVAVSEPFEFGRNGELFTLFRWTIEGFNPIRRSRRRWNKPLTSEEASYVFQ